MPSPRSQTYACHASFTVDDAVAVVFVFGLALSAWPHCLVAFVGCLLSCVVVVGALVSLVAYLRECRRIVNEEFTKPFRVTRAKEDAKDGTVKKSVSECVPPPLASRNNATDVFEKKHSVWCS